MSEDELIERIKEISILGIRSRTHVTARVFENAEKLIAVGAFCIGTNQIDLNAAAKSGIPVFNAPFSNTRSVVELVIAEIIMLMRKIPDKSVKLHNGIWDKSSEGSFEVRGKKLGIIGYGNIGTQLSVLAESLGMKVYYYDTAEKQGLGNALKCRSMSKLLQIADVVTLHVDGRESNAALIGPREFDLMKKGVIFINMSRGHVVDIHSLTENIRDGKVAGCAIDVYTHEPVDGSEEFIFELRGMPNTILTPHIGGSTLEAQENIGHYVPGKIIDYLNTGSTTNSVNFPNLSVPLQDNTHRFIHIHENVPGILAGINRILAVHGINIIGQHLKTDGEIGYVITDAGKEYDKTVIGDLSKIDHTLKFRVIC
jgi:D-3-phosphoglycerate dehydrogenase